MAKRKSKPNRTIYAYVIVRDGAPMYSQFFDETQLKHKIEEAKTLYTGVERIEVAHAGGEPVWQRG